MQKQKNKIFSLLCLIGLFWSANLQAATFANFDFVENDVTNGFDGWYYSDIGDNSCGVYAGENQSKLCSNADENGNKQSISYYYNGYNSDHMGWMRWGYLDSDSTAISGNALKFVFTGGAYNNNGTVVFSGLETKSKSQLENYLSQGTNPYSERILPGDLTLYFHSNDANDHFYPFKQLVGNDRLSVWVLPSEDNPYTLENQKYSTTYTRPENQFAWYPFVVDSNGDHYYHDLANINMGSWTHYVFDAHPDHNNGGDSNPYSYYRAGGSDFPGDAVSYFNNVHSFSLRGSNAANLPSPASMHIDEMEAYKATQPENDETIAGLGIGFDPNTKIFDISFGDKYICGSCSATYEVKYSFAPITNANYASANLPKVINFDRTKNNDNGLIYKPNTGYKQIWAALELQTADKASLTDGQTIYFAVKDVSDRSALTERDTYELETVEVPDLGAVRRVDLVKTSYYKIYPVFRQLYFNSQTINSGHKNQTYSEQLAVKGGQKPYTFSLANGNLPAGLTLSADGIISGTPTVTGTYTFNVGVNEASSFAQVIAQDFSLAIYDAEICTDAIDNDSDGLSDCADSDCYADDVCTVALVDFAQPHVFGLANWNTLLKDAYTNYVATGPGGMTVTVGQSGDYNFQGVQGSEKIFAAGDRMLVFWHNAGNSSVTFTPTISFNDNDRKVSGTSGDWHLMSELTLGAQKSGFSQFVFDQSTANAYSLVNVNVNQDNAATLICDKINFLQNDKIAPASPDGLNVL